MNSLEKWAARGVVALLVGSTLFGLFIRPLITEPPPECQIETTVTTGGSAYTHGSQTICHDKEIEINS